MMDEEREAPKKIALKVPSLFLQGTASPVSQSTSQGPKDVEQKKPKRPMPASKKKQLEAKNNEAESTLEKEHVDSVSQSSNVSSSEPKRKPSRPMPASARRKLEETTENRETAAESNSNDPVSESDSKTTTPKVSNRGLAMPVFAKTKLFHEWFGGKLSGTTGTPSKPHESDLKKENVNEGPKECISEDNVGSPSNSSVSVENVPKQIRRPMPASAKRLLEDKADGTNLKKPDKTEMKESSPTDSQLQAEGETVSKKKISRPMPASARRRMEDNTEDKTKMKNDTVHLEANVAKEQCHAVENSPDEIIKTSRRESKDVEESHPAEANAALVEPRKINISLGGIKFPTFKKPMPAFAKRKEEERQAKETTTESKNQNNSTDISAEEQKGPVDQQIRSSRRGKSSGEELLELTDQKYPCEICGTVFYSLSTQKKHIENIHLNESDPSATKTKPKKNLDKSTTKRTKEKKKSKYRGMQACPYCNKPFSNWRKVASHVSKCKLPAKYECSSCEKKFKRPSDLEAHKRTHEKTKVEKNGDMEAVPIPLSINDEFDEDPAPSPMSVDSKSSSKHSVVEKPKPMPKSVKAKLKKGSNESEKTSDSIKPEVLPKGVQSFKRKIADVLSSLGSKKFNNSQLSNASEDEVERPPPKKIKGDDTESESIRGHPMPASVKKKLQNRGEKEYQKKSSAPPSPKSQDVDNLECEICHKVFSSTSGRIRHERTVHGIENPVRRDGTSPSTTVVAERPVTPPHEVKTAVVKNDTKSKIDFNSLPKEGKCPICSKYVTRLKRHIGNVHKIKAPGNPTNVTSTNPVVRPSAPKSYKIYKSATSKYKKFAMTYSKKPVVSLEKIEVPVKTEVKTEAKVIASTASSDLRCACCDKIFEVSCDFYEHMTMRHSKTKRLITCKLCDHRFSHEEDFLLHMQFKHQNLVADMKPKIIPKQPEVQNPSKHIKQEKQLSTHSTRTQKSIADKGRQKTETLKRDIPVTKSVSVTITIKDKKLADAAFKKQRSKKAAAVTTNLHNLSTRSKRSRVKTPTPDPEPMDDANDYNSDHNFDDSAAMDVDESDSEIAITSTFSQKVASPQKQSSSVDLDPMHCSTCSEVFYSYEALRKHELYFHNVKTTKMCPICGVYPTRLSRHLLAHENKTVRCSCVPCQLNFPDFSQLLKHNLEKHPGVDGGAQSAPNKLKGQKDLSSTTATFRCTLCRKEFTGSSSARRHVRRGHPEVEEDAENFLTQVGVEDDTKIDSEVEEVLEDTNKKLLDPDWNTDDNDTVVPQAPASKSSGSSVVKSKRPMPASVRAKLKKTNDTLSDTSKVSSGFTEQISKREDKPMPASVRAKMDAASDKKKIVKEDETLKDNTESKPAKRKLMPASVRAKLEAQANAAKESALKETPESKPVKAMPASVRAKLMSSTSSSISENSRDSSIVSGASKSRRPMPASMKAKLNASKPSDSCTAKDTSLETTSIITNDNNFSSLTAEDAHPKNVKQDIDDSPPVELLTLEDAQVSDSFPDPPESLPPSIPTFSIADEIAEHNKAVQMVMGNSDSTPAADSNFNFYMFQCKICMEKFETGELVRRHIRRSHSEYGPEHTDGLVISLFDSYTDTPRRGKSNVRYTEDYVDDDEDEIMPSKGTTRRPKSRAANTDWGTQEFLEPSTSSYVAPKKKMLPNRDSPLPYACKWCGQRKDSPANVKRHIHKAHPHLKSKGDEGIILAGPDQESEYIEPQHTVPKSDSGNLRAGNPIFVCKICSRCMAVRHSLYVHIGRSHPEVKDNIADYIQELNGNAENSATKDNVVEEDNQDNSFYCSFCPYQSNDEHDYVRHYKEHTGVSPYQCQYCSATFNRKNQLNAHVTREHTGAEFLTTDEAEISMEEVVGQNEISIATSSKIHIDSPRIVSLNQKYSSESNVQSETETVKKRKPGPASRKSAAAKKVVQPAVIVARKSAPPVVTAARDDSPPNSPMVEDIQDPASPEVAESSFSSQKGPTSFTYQGDLSSLFPALGGGSAPGGMDDIDGGMELD